MSGTLHFHSPLVLLHIHLAVEPGEMSRKTVKMHCSKVRNQEKLSQVILNCVAKVSYDFVSTRQWLNKHTWHLPSLYYVFPVMCETLWICSFAICFIPILINYSFSENLPLSPPTRWPPHWAPKLPRPPRHHSLDATGPPGPASHKTCKDQSHSCCCCCWHPLIKK